MKKLSKTFLTVLLLIPATFFAKDNNDEVLKKQAPLTREKSVTVNVKYGNGYIDFNKTKADNVYEGEFKYAKYRPDVRYEVVGDEGLLDIHFSGKLKKDDDNLGSLTSLNNIYDNELLLSLTPEVPLDLNLELGVIKGNLDFSGLKINNLDLEIGVSKGIIFFDEPNSISLENCSIEGGVGKFKIKKLGNANIRSLFFEGGVGSYELDFSGEYQQNLRANIELGMGKVKLYLPRYIGTRVEVSKSFLATCSIDEVYKKDDYYTNDNWNNTRYNLDLKIETGVGKIDVVWVDK